MATRRKTVVKNPPVPEKGATTELSELDRLIATCFKELCKSLKGKAKLGDLLKMIELRRKLAPSDTAQREFWQMLERIRSEGLPGKEKGKTTAGKVEAERHDPEE